MPSNIEIKAVLNDRSAVEAIAARMADGSAEVFEQEDIFFACDGARLKLRIFSDDRGELVRYERPNLADLRCSRYLIAHTSDPLVLLEILSKTLGRVGIVKKVRTLYLVGQTRVHLDQVADLGEFLEIEVVLRPGQSDAEGRTIADALLSKLGITRKDLIGDAYLDLLSRRLAPR